ncbi:MAG: SurA N-terminal domain-containing protein [Bacteroidaceae bacterium]|nr:SurA N-terminal domain-containing protein [Bacteroidaceae bacterium]
MAAIQKIRSYGPWLIAVIGIALFAFVAGDLFKWFEQQQGVKRMQVGSIYGDNISYQDFQEEEQTFESIVKVQRALSGQDDNISEADRESMRSYLWQQHLQNSIIAHESEKLGLYVSDEEVQQALRDGNAGSLRMIAMFLTGNPQAPFSLQALQDFLKNKDKYIENASKNGSREQIEQITQIEQVWTYTEKQLRKELLGQKFYNFIGLSFASNPTLAKFEYENNVNLTDALVAAIPFSTIADKDVQVTDADLQQAYETYKERFFVPYDTRDIQLIDVAVTANASDRQALTKDMQTAYEGLSDGTDPAYVVNHNKSLVQYVALPLRREVYQQVAADLATRLDSVGVGATLAPYTDAQSNTMTTFRLVAKQQLPDSIQFRLIAAPAASADESAKRADSIFNAIQAAGAGNDSIFKSLATKYGQPGDSTWIRSEQFESFSLSDNDIQMYQNLYEANVGELKVIKIGETSIVIQVLNKRAFVDKYQVAAVRREIRFSPATYSAELGKLNKFLAENQTIASIEKNAGKSGYVLTPINAVSGSDLLSALRQRIGGSTVKDFVTWAFDEAEAGQISQLYEAGAQNDHLLVGALTATNKKGYMPITNPAVKEFLTNVVRQQKKAEKLLAQYKNVKSFEAASALAGVVTDSINGNAFGQPVMLQGVGTQELLLSAVLAKATKGQFIGPVAGAGAIYFVQVLDKRKGEQQYDEAQMLQQLAQQDMQAIIMSNPFTGQTSHQLLSALQEKANVVDNRYKF